MNVNQLIAELLKVENKALEVYTEGCDCDGDVGSVSIESNENNGYCVYLSRSIPKPYTREED